MAWLELVVRPVPRAHIEALSEALWASGVAGVQERDPPEHARPPRQPWDTHPPPPPPPWVELVAWLDDQEQVRAEAAVRALLPEATLTTSAVPDTDWEAESQRSFRPVRISDRLTVAPPWDAPPGAVIVEPGVGFGTGDHPTTRAALTLLERLAGPGVRTLDVGCGSGILAVAAASLGAHAEGIDIEADAVEAARVNAARNGLHVPFSTTPLHRVPGRFALVLANLHAELLVLLADEILRHTDHHLVLAGILDDREEGVRARYDAALGAPLQRLHDAPWVALHYARDLT